MPTENRRVAAYLPKSIDDRLEAFKTERGLKGDSPALIAILEEYFGVSREVAHISSSEVEHLSERIAAVDQRIDRLKNDILDELPGELKNLLFFWKAEFKNELLSELKSSLPKFDTTGADHIPASELPLELSSELLNQKEENTGDLGSELLSEPYSRLNPLTEAELAERWKLKNPRSIRNKRTNSHGNTQEFIDWSTEKDPENVAWNYRKDTRRYHPILPDSQGS